MYERFFGLQRRPFSRTPDPAFLCEGRRHGEALARLLLGVEDKDIVLLTGEVGAGKTTLCRSLLDRLDARYRVVLLINPRLSASQVLTVVAARLGVDPPEGGTFLFLDVAEHLDDSGLEGFMHRCMDHNLVLAPGSSCGSAYGTYVRVCFTSAPPDVVARGVDVLARLLER